MRIGVIMGGISSEREISLQSGAEVMKYLNRQKYDQVIPIMIDSKKDVIQRVKGIDFAFLALHGKYGEDGTIKGALETLGIPYSGCGVLSSAICMNKSLTKMVVKECGYATPRWITYRSTKEIDYGVLDELGYPLFIKPNHGGSSVATFFIRDRSEVLDAVHQVLKYDTEALIEQFIDGEEITSFVLNREVYPTIVIKANKGEFFNYESKYQEKGAKEEVIQLEESIQTKVDEISLALWDALYCKCYVRFDMIICKGVPYVLEANTLPGLTSSSLIPKSAMAKGVSFTQLLDKIIEYSL
ncbi:MAG TPA: D-alanine--D-alanine ligase [Lachnospiraceae bacterium]|nr:D-alanine--D-alanine ligase [Lachnospiraceae bacterium]